MHILRVLYTTLKNVIIISTRLLRLYWPNVKAIWEYTYQLSDIYCKQYEVSEWNDIFNILYIFKKIYSKK